MASHRVRVREALRAVAVSNANDRIRAAALCALGRAGSPEDAELFLRILRTPRQPREVVQGAAIGLAALPRLTSDEDRTAVRELFGAVVADRLKMPERTRLLAIMALSLRGRSDPALFRTLGARLEKPGLDANEAAAVLYGTGLTRLDLSSSVLIRASEAGEIRDRRLHDVARSYGVLSVALAGGAKAAPALLRLLEAKDTQVHSRRSAALALGHLLREGAVEASLRASLGKILRRRMVEDPDPLVQGWCALAYGFGSYDTKPLLKLLDSGTGTTRPYAALALGLVARSAPDAEAATLRELLLTSYRKARGNEVPGALAIALALAGAGEARDLLAAHVASPRVRDGQRGPACQALGLLGGGDPKCGKALLVALNDSSDEVAQNAALGLGLYGGPDSARLLVKLLAVTRSALVQAHMVTGLSHLGGVEAVPPLLVLLRDATRKREVRISAATALGLIVAPREDDLLFELDAYTNPYGLTEAGRDLVVVF
jgi:HEAT repeat protein